MPGGSSDGIVQVGGVLLSMMVAQQVADAIPDHLKIEGSSNLRGSMEHVKVFNAKETAQAIPDPASADTLIQQELPGIVQSTLAEFAKSGFSSTLASTMMMQLSMTAATLLGQQLAHAMCAKRAAPNAERKEPPTTPQGEPQEDTNTTHMGYFDHEALDHVSPIPNVEEPQQGV